MTTTASIGFLPDEVYTDKILNGQISTGGSKEDVKLLYVFCPKNFRRNKLGRLKGDVLVLPQRAQNHIKFSLDTIWQCLLSIDNFLSVYIQNESIIQFELWALNTLHFGIGVCVCMRVYLISSRLSNDINFKWKTKFRCGIRCFWRNHLSINNNFHLRMSHIHKKTDKLIFSLFVC